MIIDREPIYSSLRDLIQTIPSAVFDVSRRIKHWDEINVADCPYIAVVQQSETADQTDGSPIRWIFYPEVFVYVQTSNDPSVNPYTQLNQIIGEICDLFEPEALDFEEQNLGGLVQSVTINGGVEMSGGVLGPKAMAVIPLRIVVNN